MGAGHELPPDWQVSAAHRENFMTDVAMILVAAAHVCTCAWLLFMRSSHGILCAFGSSVALVAALLWWHLVRPSTHTRIMFQTLGLGLAGLCLVVRTLLEYWFGRGAAGQPGAAAGGADAGAVGDGALGQSSEGGQQKEMGLQIIGAEQWLIAWRSVCQSFAGKRLAALPGRVTRTARESAPAAAYSRHPLPRHAIAPVQCIELGVTAVRCPVRIRLAAAGRGRSYGDVRLLPPLLHALCAGMRSRALASHPAHTVGVHDVLLCRCAHARAFTCIYVQHSPVCASRTAFPPRQNRTRACMRAHKLVVLSLTRCSRQVWMLMRGTSVPQLAAPWTSQGL